MHGEELDLLLKQDRGQFLDFVSAYERRKSGSQEKDADELARELSRLLAGMANADGGILLAGIESDKSVTGVPYLAEEIQELVQAPRSLLTPALNAACQKLRLGNLQLLKFDVGSSFEVHRVAGGRTFYRIGAENLSLPLEQIQTLKQSKRSSFYERQTATDATWEDLDPRALETFAQKINDPRPASNILGQGYHLIDNSGQHPAMTTAAMLLFARDPTRWHPRCGIDFVKFDGTERQHGAALNVVRRIRFEAPLCGLIDEAVGRIKEHIKEKTVLHDLFFRERLEYPTFAWQEALVNAVAHRDYSLTGTPIEVWMFDDRIEVRSPGLPPHPVAMEELRQQRRIHFSRNPLLVRALADLGYLREMGEGIPRMFHEMEHHGLRPPEFSAEGFLFTVTLRNTPIYDETTLRWLLQFEPSTISFRQRRILAYAYIHGKSFNTSDYQRIAEVDRDTAYRDIRAMIRLGIAAPLKPKSRSYRIIERL